MGWLTLVGYPDEFLRYGFAADVEVSLLELCVLGGLWLCEGRVVVRTSLNTMMT